MAKLREQPRVQAGQIWKSGDPRPERQKYIKVLDVWESLVVTAKCDANGVVQYNRETGEPTTHTVLAKRFGGQRSGYVFVQGPTTYQETGNGFLDQVAAYASLGGVDTVIQSGVSETDDALIADLEQAAEGCDNDPFFNDSEDDSNSYDYENERYDDDLDPEDEDGSFEGEEEEVLQASDNVRNEG